MELWFEAHWDASGGTRTFRPSKIDLQKLIENQDINELLVLVEYILNIVLKCDNSEELLQAFVELPENSAEDL